MSNKAKLILACIRDIPKSVYHRVTGKVFFSDFFCYDLIKTYVYRRDGKGRGG
jgi:hypothetical protein